MRWWWIDKFIEFESGRRARTVKSISLAEEQLDDYLPGYPIMPHSLVIEGLAQTGGLLVGQLSDFQRRVVLAKVSKAIFHFSPQPGDRLTYEAVLENIQDDGALVCCTSHAEDRLQAEIDLYFAYFDNRDLNRDQFIPADFARILRIFKLFDVGVDEHGNPIQIPAHLKEAEQRMLQ